MVTVSETVSLCYFSGYIRNWKALCGELSLPEDLPRKQREEGLLIAAYEKWGMEMMSHLYGMFAFVLKDQAIGMTFAVRDQVGQKQLFYTIFGGELLCSGDINEIVRRPGFDKRLNLSMLQQYLFYGYPIGSETFYEGVHKLLPGHYAAWDGQQLRVHTYWQPVFEPDETKTCEQWADEIEAVARTILTEEKEDPQVPYKESFLSGGVDSSYLLACGDAVCANTVGYAESSFDESSLAAETAAVLGRDFRVKQITPEAFFERIPEVMDKMGQPLGDASAVAFSIGCAAVAEHTKVVYSGEGIDEFFGGYNAHRNHLPEDWVYLTCSHIMSEEVVRSLMTDYSDSVKAADPVMPLWKATAGLDELSRKLTIDISLWLEGDIYLNTDRTSTACGVELHTPFSDRRLFDVARRIPASCKFAEDQNKYVFRLAASRLLPPEAAFRKKVGFPVPVRKWLARESFRPAMEAKLFGEASRRFFRQEELRSQWERFLAGEEFLWNRLYAVYAFLVWYDINFAD